MLNAKASEFRPIPRPLSAASSNPASLASLRAETPSPDLWSHNSQRPTSKLAIAAPLTPDSSLLPRSITPSSSLRSSLRPDDDDDEEDPFDPFAAKAIPRSFHPVDHSGVESYWGHSPLSGSQHHDDSHYHYANNGDSYPSIYGPQLEPSRIDDDNVDIDSEASALLTDGMTPFDVLSSVFGASLAPSELEEALANNAYDFERAMNWLVDKAIVPHPTKGSPARMQNMGNRVTLVSHDGQSGVHRGGRASYGNLNTAQRGVTRFGNGRPVPGGNRVCRYFLAGECLRADCRFR